MTPEGFVSFAEAMAELGYKQTTLRKRLDRWGMTTYVNPRDERCHMIRREDFERLRNIRIKATGPGGHKTYEFFDD